jgi:hypothetical protein
MSVGVEDFTAINKKKNLSGRVASGGSHEPEV